MSSSPQGCVFCERILKRRSDVVWDQPIAETPDYLVVPTKGSILPGWLLVVSKNHLLCTGAMGSEAAVALRHALAVARELVEPVFGSTTLFEHGPTTEGMALGCGVDHLHVHVAPLPFSLRAAFQELYEGSTWAAVSDWTDLRSVHRLGIPYVAIQEPGGELAWSIAPNDTRQPLRRAVASAIGASECFDYNAHPHIENAQRTVDLLTAV